MLEAFEKFQPRNFATGFEVKLDDFNFGRIAKHFKDTNDFGSSLTILRSMNVDTRLFRTVSVSGVSRLDRQ